MSEAIFLEQFERPPAAYRSMPFWVWNGEMSEARISEMLEQFAEQGIGGVFIHPRPGLTIEYLSERWFELWEFSLKECKRLGLECHVYDENSYPAGFAGGWVPARIPHAAAQYVRAAFHETVFDPREGRLLGFFRLDASGVAIPISEEEAASTELRDRGAILALSLRVAPGRAWCGGFSLTDLTRPEVAKEFIATTYEPYARRFGADFGKSIRYFFCDEPLLATANNSTLAPCLPLSQFILKEFYRDHGYGLEEKLADLFVDGEESPATRFDYYRTLQRLYTRNFLEPLHGWCERHGVALTGHFMEHEWPFPRLTPSCMEAYRWMQMPGVDLLAFQFDAEDPARCGHYVMTFREMNSAANQLGRERRLCETHGVGGYEATLEEFKRLSDWVMVNGVNFVNQHLSFQTISGARKYDHPQTFSDHSAWWGSYRVHADHVARLSWALSQGSQNNRILVLHSTTTGWLAYNPTRDACRSIHPGAEPSEPVFRTGAMETLRQQEAALVQWLADHQVDFDLGDELLMAELGSVDGGKLRIGQCAYDLVIIPEGMENWCASTAALMDRYFSAGGRALALRPPPRFVDGRPSSLPCRLMGEHPGRWEVFASFADLQPRLDALVPPRVQAAGGGPLPPLVGHQMRELGNGESLHFFANHGAAPVQCEVRLRGGSVRALSTSEGVCTPLECRAEEGDVIAPLELPHAGHALWLVSRDASPRVQANAPAPAMRETEIAAFASVERTGPNVLGLDFCDLEAGSHRWKGLYVTQANLLCWQQHGFDRDVWDRGVQFRRNFFDMEFDPDSGFRADYSFEVSEALLRHPTREGIELALEHPELYTVTLNGEQVAFTRRWLDETIRAGQVGPLLRGGWNRITLEAKPFHILCEIDRVYLLGDFGLEPSPRGFRLALPSPVGVGDWTRQGLPQYDGAVCYRTAVTLEEAASAWEVEIPRWAGAAVKVSMDGEEAGVIAFSPYRLRVAQSLAAGSHELALEVVGTPKNLLGPHFHTTPLAHRLNLPLAWEQFPAEPAPGDAYEILPMGLLGPVRWRICGPESGI